MNLAVGENSSYAALDAEALRAVAARRYAGRRAPAAFRRGGPGRTPSPPRPLHQSPRPKAIPPAEDRWEKELRLVFPQSYQQRAIEGWAILRYDVAPWGQIGAVTVLAAEPSSEFGEAARNVLNSAKFKPRESGLSGCIDRVFFRIRKDDRAVTDGASETRGETD